MQRCGDPDRPFGGLTPFARRVIGLARSEGVSALGIDPADVDLATGRVRGLLLKDGRWTPAAGPLPDVVWNRYFRRDRDDLLHEFARRGIPLLNESGLNKWEAYQLLLDDPMLREHLPETRLMRTGADINDLTSQYRYVFLKPVAGAVGRGIIRASLQPTGLTRLEYISADTGQLRAVEGSRPQLDRWAQEREGSYVVQQGLDLAVFYGRSADVRALLQKDGEGRWQMTGMGARVAAADRFTANLHTGGNGVPLGLLAGAIFPDDTEQREVLELELQSLAVRTAEVVDAAMGPMGELGLDFGIDSQGRIWYIEQNAQPGRTLFEHLGREDLAELAHRRPVQYARYLAQAKSARAAGHQET
jgi:hypothetical protein